MAGKSQISCICPNCEETLTFKRTLRVGEKLVCPNCKKSFIAPDPEEEVEERPRKKKRKEKSAKTNFVLYAALGGGAVLLVILIAVAGFFYFRSRNRPTDAKEQEQAQINPAGGNDKQKKNDPIAPKGGDPFAPKGGPGVKLDDLPTWTPDPALVVDLDPAEQTFSPRAGQFRLKIPTQWQDTTMPDYRSLGPYTFNYKFGQMWLFCNSGSIHGFTPGKRGPKEVLYDWMTISERKEAVKKAAEKIEMGRSGNVALARCFVLDASPPTLYWSAVTDGVSVIMRLEIDTRLPAKHHGTLIKLFEASILTFRK